MKAKEKNSKNRKKSKWNRLLFVRLVIGLAVVMVGIAGFMAVGYLRPSTGSLQLQIIQHEPYTASRMAKFTLRLTNHSTQSVMSPFGTCAEMKYLYIDTVLVTPRSEDDGRAVCAIGYGSIAAGETRTQQIALNLRGLRTGSHVLKVVTTQPGEEDGEFTRVRSLLYRGRNR